MSGLTYLITGANRGIGYGLVEALLKRPNTTVIGTVRNPSSSSSAFSKLRPASGSRLVVVKIDSEVPGNAKTAVAEVQSQHNISKLDIVIANAGIAEHYAPAATTSLEQMSRHYAINVIAPVALFQAVLPLLQKSSNPKFVGISTGAASLKAIGDIPLMTTAYGSSKASLNFVLRKMHFEHENIIIYPINPGWVQTDMGNRGAKSAGMDEAPLTLEASVTEIVKNIDGATKAETSGEFQTADGIKYDW